MHTSLIAQVLTSIGFIAQIHNGNILVSLNRKVNTMEVQTALEQEFSGIQFKVIQYGNSVIVEE